MAIVTLRYWAAAKDAAGLSEEKVEAITLADALAAAAGRSGAGQSGPGQSGELSRLLASCSFLINGEPAGKRPRESVVLGDDAVVEVLPPFAGG